jgi:hypothetical protein
VNQHQIIADRVTTLPVSGWVEGVRVVKDSEEESYIRQACQISDDALESLLPKISVGMTEREIARALEGEMLDRGAEGLAFESIVAGGPHSAIPHHQPTQRPLESGDLLKIDFGARVAGYHADQTRTFVMGRAAAWQTEIHAVVAQAQARGQQVVLLSQVLAADVNTGYDELSNLQLLTFNDLPISSLAALAAAVAACTDPFFRFGLDSGETVVLDAAKARQATPAILATHCIPSAASADLMQ